MLRQEQTTVWPADGGQSATDGDDYRSSVAKLHSLRIGYAHEIVAQNSLLS